MHIRLVYAEMFFLALQNNDCHIGLELQEQGECLKGFTSCAHFCQLIVNCLKVSCLLLQKLDRNAHIKL